VWRSIATAINPWQTSPTMGHAIGCADFGISHFGRFGCARREARRARQSALNLAAARLRHIAGTAWSTKRYLNMELLKDQQMRGAITA
jgi:hypothetical protein